MSSYSKLYPRSKRGLPLLFVRDSNRIGHHMKHMTDMAEHYVVTASDNYGMTGDCHQRFLD
jgi:hypothetical protein